MMILDTKDYGHSCYEVVVRTHDETEFNAIQSYAKLLNKTSKPMTNADYIRSMSDEELAEFLGCIHDFSGCISLARDCRPTCLECITAWLAELYEEEEI